MRLSHDTKEQALAGMRLLGTEKAGALAANITLEKLKEELKKSAIFRKRANEAKVAGKSNLGESGLDVIVKYALDPPEKTDRNRLTAAIALCNAFIPGFRGATTVQGRIDHDVRVITAVPRPNYGVLDKPSEKMLKLGKRTKKVIIRDKDGEYIGTQTVEEAIIEEAIEGEVIKERE